MTKGKSGAAGRRRTWAMTAAGLMLLGSAAVNLAGAQDAPPETAPEAAPETAEDPAAAAPAETPAPAAAEETASDGGAPAQPPAETAAETASETPASETPAEPPAETGADVPPESPADASETDAAESEAPVEDAAEPPAGPGGPLVVVSWGGVYSKSQEEAIYRPFTRATGIEVSRKIYAGDLDQIRSQVASGEVTWDVVDVGPADAEAGCNEGLFQPLSFVLPAAPDGTAATEDFLPGTLHPCAVGSVAWSMVLAYDAGEETGGPDEVRPGSLEDFFDLTTFPGQRGLRRTPMANLEWALLADGAAPAEVYDLLRTPAGVERAFAKLDSIKEAVVWWEDASEPARLLASGEVVMTSTYNAPIFNDIAVRQQPYELIWDHQVWDIDLWAIPAEAPNREAALEFLRFATDAQPLARQTRWLPYGPLRRSSAPLVGDFVHADIDVAAYLPTAPENLETALRNDALFWREEGPALVDQFNQWLAR